MRHVKAFLLHDTSGLSVGPCRISF